MKQVLTLFISSIVILNFTGCVATQSERVFEQKLPKFVNETGADVTTVKFSDDKKYESEKGVPFKGEPVICKNGQAYTATIENAEWHDISVKSDEEVAVTVIIKWTNTGWTKTCWPFVAFKPEKNASYVVVNERIGGKGWSSLWTGVAGQSCAVSVFKENGNNFERIKTSKPSSGICGDLSSN